MSRFHLQMAVRCLLDGGVLAYPTEAVWGLGCDPDNAVACMKLLQIKRRPLAKGMILVAADMQQIADLLAPLTPQQRAILQQSWPGPTTWLIPDYQHQVPDWIRGEHRSVAVRVSAHSGVQALCRAFGGPLVSTSANLSDKPPARSRLQLERQLHGSLDYVLPGLLGSEAQPSRIVDLR